MGTTAVDRCRCSAKERIASGYKNPTVLGVLAWQPSEVALQQLCPAPPDALVLLAMVVSGAWYTVWGGS